MNGLQYGPIGKVQSAEASGCPRKRGIDEKLSALRLVQRCELILFWKGNAANTRARAEATYINAENTRAVWRNTTVVRLEAARLMGQSFAAGLSGCLTVLPLWPPDAATMQDLR